MRIIELPISGKYKIGDTSIPDPSGISVSINPLHGEATGRTDDGTMHTELIGTPKLKVELRYDAISDTQLSTLLTLLNVQYYSFTFPDVTGQKTIECYGTAVSYEPDIGVYYNNAWRNVKISCIER